MSNFVRLKVVYLPFLPQQMMPEQVGTVLNLERYATTLQVIPYFVAWMRGEARPHSQAQKTSGGGQGKGIASALNMHRGGSCGYDDPRKADCYLYRNAIASLFYKLSDNACDPRSPGCDSVYFNDDRIAIQVNYINSC